MLKNYMRKLALVLALVLVFPAVNVSAAAAGNVDSVSAQITPSFADADAATNKEFTIKLDTTATGGGIKIGDTDVQLELTGTAASKFGLYANAAASAPGSQTLGLNSIGYFKDMLGSPLDNTANSSLFVTSNSALATSNSALATMYIGMNPGMAIAEGDGLNVSVTVGGVNKLTVPITLTVAGAPPAVGNISTVTADKTPTFGNSDAGAATNKAFVIELGTASKGIAISSSDVKLSLTGTAASKFALYASATPATGVQSLILDNVDYFKDMLNSPLDNSANPILFVTSNQALIASNSALATVYMGMNPGASIAASDTLSVLVTIGGVNMLTVPITLTPTSAAPGVISGTAYVYIDGTKSPLAGVNIYAYGASGEYLYANTGADGTYSLNVPNFSAAGRYTVYASAVDLVQLNQAETAVSWDSVTVTEARSDVNFSFVVGYSIPVKGRVLDQNQSPVAGVSVTAGTSYITAADGAFTTNSYIYYYDGMGSQSVSISAAADGYESSFTTKTVNVTIDTLKQGYVDVGDIAITKKSTGGVYGDITANNFIVTPNATTPGSVSRATLKLNANATATQTQTVTIAADNGATVMVDSLDKISVSKGGKKLNKNQLAALVTSSSFSAAGFTISMPIEPKVDYQFTFGIQAPEAFDTAYYTASASVAETPSAAATKIDNAVVLLNGLTITAPFEIGTGDKFMVYGDVVFDKQANLQLKVVEKGENGTDLPTETLQITKDMGMYYKFDELGPLTEEGAYTATVTFSNGGHSVSTDINVVEKPIKLTGASIKNGFNTVNSANLTPGKFITFSGFVDGILNSIDYYDMTASVTMSNAEEIASGRFILKTSHGTFTYDAAKSGDTFSGSINTFKGVGKAELVFEATKTDGSVHKFTFCKLILLVDPSGYVYDTDTGSPITGAVCTLWVADPAVNEWSVWEAEPYMQINPQITGPDGKYGWMVPDGFVYEIRVTADGYSPATSLTEYGVLPVLPEQTEINIAMTKTATDSPEQGGGSRGGSSAARAVATPSYTAKAEAVGYNQTVALGDLPFTVNTAGALKNGTVITLKLPKGFEWTNAEPAFKGTGGLAGAKISSWKYGAAGGIADKGILLLTLGEVGTGVKAADTFTIGGLAFLVTKDAETGEIVLSTQIAGAAAKNVTIGTLGEFELVDVSLSVGEKLMTIGDTTVEMDTAPYLNNDGRTMLPLRFAARAFGITDNNISWNGAANTASLYKGADKIAFTVGSNYMLVNDEPVLMDTQTEIKDNRTFVSVRYISEALGIELDWDSETETVSFVAKRDLE